MSSPFGAEPARRALSRPQPAEVEAAEVTAEQPAAEADAGTVEVAATATVPAAAAATAAPHTLVTGTTVLAPPAAPPRREAPPADGPAERSAPPPPPLRVGQHHADGPALDAMSGPGTGAGLVVGYDNENRPVPIRIFRPEGTRVALVGGLWITQLVVFRALAVGARVTVVTGRPESWSALGPAATHREDRFHVAAEQPPLPPGSPRGPVLLVLDGDVLGVADRTPLGPWQTRLTAVPQLTPYGLPAVRDADLTLAQRLTENEAGHASALDLDAGTGRLLQMLQDDMLALITAGTARYVWVVPTELEEIGLGGAAR